MSRRFRFPGRYGEDSEVYLHRAPGIVRGTVDIQTATAAITSATISFGVTFPSGTTPTVIVVPKNLTDRAVRFNSLQVGGITTTSCIVYLVVATAVGGSSATIQWEADIG